MKKFIFSFIACGFMATMMSCSNADEPIIPGDKTQNFPGGADVTEVTITVPNEARTRSDLDGLDLPLWGLFSESGSAMKIRYGVYREDGTLYYSTDEMTELPKAYSATFTLSIPIPRDERHPKIFMWADKDEAIGYNIDWEKKKVIIDYENPLTNLYADMAKNADAFAHWGDLNPYGGETRPNLILTRPFVQVNILTDEPANNASLMEKYKEGMGAMMCMSRQDMPERNIFLYGWNWDDDTFDAMEDYEYENGMRFSSVFNHTSSLENSLKGTSNDGYAGTIGGKRKYYAGVFYLFAPKGKNWVAYTEDYPDENMLDVEESGGLIFETRIMNKEEYNMWKGVDLSFPVTDGVTQNTRLIVHNGANNGTGNGVLSDNQNYNIIVDENFNGDIDVDLK